MNNGLRIGNWLQYKGRPCSRYFQVEGLYKGQIVDFPHGSALSKSAYEPVPLTPEILKQVGFGDSEVLEACYQLEGSAPAPFDDGKECYVKHGKTQVKYVHELQNLYFALTGSELSINL